MLALRICVGSFVLVLTLTAVANAKFDQTSVPPIQVDKYLWTASQVVVVGPVNDSDGRVTILETLSGNLRPGDSLNIPELTNFRFAKSRRMDCSAPPSYFAVPFTTDPGYCTNKIPAIVPADAKVIIFLAEKPSRSRDDEWSALGGFWIHLGKAYAPYDGDHPWKGPFINFGDELGLRDSVRTVSAEKGELASALQIEDMVQRRQALQHFAASIDPKTPFGKWGTGYIRDTVARVSANDIAFTLAALLKRELDYWRKEAPDLMPGWDGPEYFSRRIDHSRRRTGYSTSWEEKRNPAAAKLSADKKEELNAQLATTAAILQAIIESGYSEEGIAAVTEFRGYWVSLPQLAGLYIRSLCDAFLDGVIAR